MAGRYWYIDSHGKRKRTAEGIKHELSKFQSSDKAKKDRAARNSARRSAIRKGLVHKGDHLDVHHTTGNPRDNSHTTVISRSANRSKREESRLKRSKRNKRTWGK